MGKKIRQASRTLWVIVKAKEPESKKDAQFMGNLGTPSCCAIKGRLKVRSVEKINQLLHNIGIRMATLREKTWKTTIGWPEMGTLQWKESRIQSLPKRMNGKQKEPEDRKTKIEAETVGERNNPTEPVSIKKVENIRSKPSYRSMVREHVQWTEEEKKELEQVKHQPEHFRMREERRLLFNRSSAEKRIPRVRTFQSMGGKVELKCNKCEKVCDLQQKG